MDLMAWIDFLRILCMFASMGLAYLNFHRLMQYLKKNKNTFYQSLFRTWITLPKDFYFSEYQRFGLQVWSYLLQRHNIDDEKSMYYKRRYWFFLVLSIWLFLMSFLPVI